MRVISGSARGRTLKSVPGKGTRPTSDRVKEAIFSMIGPYFAGGEALDLFAGTGGLGIEALSRGMDRAVFVDLEQASVDVVRGNLRSTGLEDRAEVYRNDAVRALKLLARRGRAFDLVFLDPPYKMRHMDELARQMQELNMLKRGSRVVIEHAAEHHYPEDIGQLVRKKRAEYGDTAVSIYVYQPTDEVE
jgi:16S rRNA (guanine(966)-N(2))-methyltransferase RsmD